MAASEKSRTSKSDTLLLYRLDQVEAAVKAVGEKVDKQENIKKSDLVELRNTILEKFNDIRTDLQKQIDDLDEKLKSKADSKDIKDIKGLIGAVGGAFSTIIVALIIYYVTNGNK